MCLDIPVAIGKEKPKIVAPKSTTSKTQGKAGKTEKSENQSTPEEEKEPTVDSKQNNEENDSKRKYRTISSDELKEVQIPNFDPDLYVLLEPIMENQLQIPKTTSGSVFTFYLFRIKDCSQKKDLT